MSPRPGKTADLDRREYVDDELAHLWAEVEQLRKAAGLQPVPWPPVDPPAPPPRNQVPVLTHLDLDVNPPGWAAALQERIELGVCNGVFLYRSDKPEQRLRAGLPEWQAFRDVFGHLPDEDLPWITVSPKVIVPADLRAWAEEWPARWRPRIKVPPWQEPVKDLTVDQFVDLVQAAHDSLAGTGIDVTLHLEAWSLSLANDDRDKDTAWTIEVLTKVGHLVSRVDWSAFEFNEHPRHLVEHVMRIADFMLGSKALPWGVTSVGQSVPVDLPADDPRRTERAPATDAGLVTAKSLGATAFGVYGPRIGQNPTRNYWDAQLISALAGSIPGLLQPGGRAVR